MSTTTPEFTANFETIPTSKMKGLKDPQGNVIGVGIPQGEPIIVHNSEGADYMFYGLLEDATGDIDSITWDGFPAGAKSGILVIKDLRAITVKGVNTDIPLPTGVYKLVLRDDPSPSGEILGETVYFVIF